MYFDEVLEIAKKFKCDHIDDNFLINSQIFKINEVLQGDSEEERIAKITKKHVIEMYEQVYKKPISKFDTSTIPLSPLVNEKFKYFNNRPPYNNVSFCIGSHVYWVIYENYDNAKNNERSARFTLIPFDIICPKLNINFPVAFNNKLKNMNANSDIKIGSATSQYQELFPLHIERIDFYEINGEINLAESYIKKFNGDSCLHFGELEIVKNQMINDVLKFINLLNCSNIEYIKSDPYSFNKQKSRRKKGKLPLLSYKTLVINSNKFIKITGNKKEPIYSNRIHLCRGHFKNFTTKLLFGKYSGLYWWQPSVRGNNKEGVVMKRYECKGECILRK